MSASPPSSRHCEHWRRHSGVWLELELNRRQHRETFTGRPQLQRFGIDRLLIHRIDFRHRRPPPAQYNHLHHRLLRSPQQAPHAAVPPIPYPPPKSPPPLSAPLPPPT